MKIITAVKTYNDSVQLLDAEAFDIFSTPQEHEIRSNILYALSAYSCFYMRFTLCAFHAF